MSYATRRGNHMSKRTRLMKTNALALLSFVAVMGGASSRPAGASWINFDMYPDLSTPKPFEKLGYRFASWGATFPDGGEIYQPDATKSPRLAAEGPDADTEFGDTDFKINFNSGKSFVYIYGGARCG